MSEIHNDASTALSENAQTILKQRYLMKDDAGELIERPDDLFHRVASAVAEGERGDTANRKVWAKAFYEHMSTLKFLPNSPTLVNAGTGGRGCLSACFVVSPEDNMNSIMQVASDAAMIEKWGGGIGFGLSALRPAQDRIATTHGEACGPIAVMKLYSAVGATLTQGSFRLGAHMGQLNIKHPDVQAFIHCKDNDDTLQNFNITVQISDAFMEAVRNDEDWTFINPRDAGDGPLNAPAGTVRARDLWNEICESAWKTGDPGVAFMDRILETQPNPQMGDIMSSNPCVTADTPVMTTRGQTTVAKLVGKRFVARVDNKGYVSTGEGFFSQGVKPIIKLSTTSGSIKLTRDHKVWSLDAGGWVKAGDLHEGERLRTHTHASAAEAKVISVTDAGEAEVYDCTIPGPHAWDTQGIYISNCGEEWLENYGNCCLASVNLDRHTRVIGKGLDLDYEALEQTIRVAVRFLNDVIEVNQFPLDKLREVNLATRRIGLGVMGWADLLVRLGIPYDSSEAIRLAEHVGDFLAKIAWEESAEIAKERGPFSEYENSALKAKGMPPVRNSSVFTIAPTGTISRLADCSSGIEPHFASAWWSNVLWEGAEGGSAARRLLDAPRSVRQALESSLGSSDKATAVLERIADNPQKAEAIMTAEGIDAGIFRNAMEISAEAHIRMQAAWQKSVTNSVSKTINLPNSATIEDVANAYWLAWETGCKAITVYRDGSKAIQVLETGSKKEEEAPAPAPSGNRERPVTMRGLTQKVATGHGKMYVTLNFDEDNKPFELFTAIGQAGGSEPAHLEGLSRMISMNLRDGHSPARIISELEGITSEPVLDNGRIVKSAEDGIAYVLKMHANGPNKPLSTAVAANGMMLNGNGASCPKCPGQLIMQEGCASCLNCGYSKCD